MSRIIGPSHNRNIGQGATNNVQQTRVYVITEHEAKNSPDVITGMAYISDNLPRILIDPRARFSFMPTAYVKCI